MSGFSWAGTTLDLVTSVSAVTDSLVEAAEANPAVAATNMATETMKMRRLLKDGLMMGPRVGND